MIDVGSDLRCGWRWRLNWLREHVIGLVAPGLLVLQPGDGAVFVHGGSE